MKFFVLFVVFFNLLLVSSSWYTQDDYEAALEREKLAKVGKISSESISNVNNS